MIRFWSLALFACLFLTLADSAVTFGEVVELPATFSREIPDDWEEQIDKQTEQLPEEIREQMREKLKEAVRVRLSEMETDVEESSTEEESDSEVESTKDSQGADKESAKKSDKKEEPKKEKSAQDLLNEEAKKLRTEIELYATRFKHQVAMYEKEIAARRLQNEKSKIDRKLEADRVAGQVLVMQRERDRLKLEIDVIKQQTTLKQARATAKIAAAKATKAELELAMTVETAKEKLENRILGEESYPDEPFQEGVLRVSLRRIELNGPILEGAADYVCQRIDYFNNQSNKPIFLVIDSCPGGSIIEGFQIVQSIEKSEAPVHVVVKRFAASMAAIITTLADHSYCYPDAIILHHQASTLMYGNGRAIKDQTRQLKEMSSRLIGPVAEKQGLSEEEFVDLMYKNRTSGDWDLFGDQAVQRKWVNSIVTTIREEGIRNRPTGTRKPPSLRSLLGKQSSEVVTGYLERYEVTLSEETDEKGRRFVLLPRLSPVDAWMIYSPDGYYR